MKRKLLISGLITLLSISTFTGCVNDSSSQNISSSSTLMSEEAKLDNMLANLRKGVQFKGVLDQEVSYLDSYQGTPTGKKALNEYQVEINYSSKNENGYSALVNRYDATLEEDIEIINTTVFEGEDGYAYYYGLNYDNSIIKYPLLDKNGMEHMNFAYYYLNPFNYLMGKDFIKVESKENTYTLNNGKAAFFASNVLGDIDPAFFGVIENIEFKIENYELKGITVEPAIAYDSQTDYETWETIFYSLDQTIILEAKNIGTNEIKKPTPRETKDEHKALQDALNKFSSKNFKANLHIENLRDGEANGEYDIAYYYDGKNLYFTTDDNGKPSQGDILLYQYEGEEYLSPLAYDLDEDEFTAEAAKSLASMNNVFKYNDITPLISEVKAEIFDYDKFRKNYRCCDELVSFIASRAFVPLLNPIAQQLNGGCSSFVVKLTADGNIDYINFQTQTASFYNDISKCKLTFENVGTTTLPDYVYAEEK